MATEFAPAAAARLTMKDIAARAGVSVATVSRALAGSPLVTQETRAAIETLVRHTGYTVSHAGRGLRLQSSRQLLVLLPTISNPFFAEIVQAIESEAQQAGYSILIGSTEGQREREEVLARQLLSGAVDGLVLMTGRLPEGLAGLENVASRVIAISEQIAGTPVRTIGIDNALAARTAIAHLVGLGHRRIAHITGPAGNSLTEQRLAGYRAGLRDGGLTFRQMLVAGGDFSLGSGRHAMDRLLRMRPRPTAVFCGNDDMAIGAIAAARDAGIVVGRDLAVVGFDDIEYAAYCDPPLTTIRQPRRLFGRLAAAALIGRPATEPVVLPFELVIRGSCGGG